MKIYLVGGAVRDQLLGVPVKDFDWVVVGATPQAMLDRGYLPVGADFPVFLDPVSGEEYALARQERKTGDGYHGFATETNGVTLEEDLSRRDLTINAMAWADDVLHDPFNGKADLQNKVLRHVGPAFEEDPVRVLRVLRFWARFGPQWTVAPETWALLEGMVNSGATEHLVAERVWKEVSRGLMEAHPQLMLQGMQRLGLLKQASFAPYARQYPESAAWLAEASRAGMSQAVRFAVAFPQNDTRTPVAVPKDVWRLSRLLVDNPTPPDTDSEWLALLSKADFFRESTLWEALLTAWTLCGQDCNLARQVGCGVGAVDTKAITRSLPPGPAVGQAIQKARLQAVQEVLQAQTFAQ